jgi:ankyrin repeat protein
MHRIESQVPDQADLGKQTIAWIIHAHRQLTTPELQEALGVEVGQHDLDRDNCPDVDDMISACAGLVTLDVETDVLRLVHYTTQEYFDRTRQEWFPDAEATITVTCITYLSFDAYGEGRGPLKSASDNVQNPQSSLYDYAARYWGYHAKRAPSTLANVVGFLRRSSHVTTAARALAQFNSWLSEFVLGPPTSDLHMSAYFGLEAVTLAILEKTSKPDVTNSNDSTPLMVAALRGHVSMVILLLSWNARVGKTNYLEYTALYMAVCGMHEPIVRILLAHHAPTDIKPKGLDGALHISGSVTVAKLLVEAGVDVNANSERGNTPLHHACFKGDEAMARLLISFGADIQSPNNDKDTPLCIACLRSDENIARILVEAGADVNYKHPDGRTPFHCILFTNFSNANGKEAIIRLLLSAGADINYKYRYGRTMLQTCSAMTRKGYTGYDEIAGILRDHGALDEPAKVENIPGIPKSPQTIPQQSRHHRAASM